MGGLMPGPLISFAIWTGLVITAFYISHDFDKSIEIYAYGTAGWPRAILAVIGLAALAQLIDDWCHGAKRREAGADGSTGPVSISALIKVGLLMGLPIIYALLLESIGFFAMTPFFLAALVVLGGERRIGRVLLLTGGIYILLLILFAILLRVGLPVGTIGIFYGFSNWLLVQLEVIRQAIY